MSYAWRAALDVAGGCACSWLLGHALRLWLRAPPRHGAYPRPVATTTISWRNRWIYLRAAFMTLATGRHHYVSTACLDGVEGYCAAMTGMQGVKRPRTCKFCDARCEICAVTPSADAPPPGPSPAPEPPS